MYIRNSGIASQGGYRERGVVLHTLKYNERQLIIHMLTRDHGRMSYITSLSRGQNLKTASRNIFQPLSVLEFEANSTHGSMHRLAQCEPSPMMQNLSFDVAKSSIALFISELLYRLVREPLDDQNLYGFVERSIIDLDNMEKGVANFHLWFLVHFAFFMGYSFPEKYHSGQWLDIKSGEHTSWQPMHTLRIAPEYAEILHRLNMVALTDVNSIALSRVERVPLLHALVDYYSYHCDTMNNVKSIGIMSELF